MKGFDIREWKALDWAGFASLIALTLIPIISAGMKDYPEFAARMPAFISWPYLPVPLLLFLLGVITIRSLERKTPQPPQRTQNADEAKSLLPPRAFPKQRFHAPTDFLVLPRSVTVELLGQPPEVQAQFYVVSFHPRPIKLIDVELSVRVNSLPRLDDVTCRQKDLLIDPKEYEVIVCRRQLTNAESGYQWKAGRASNADFQLTAKATDGEKTFTYGPVADMVIEGWVNAGADDKNTPPPELVSKRPLPSDATRSTATTAPPKAGDVNVSGNVSAGDGKKGPGGNASIIGGTGTNGASGGNVIAGPGNYKAGDGGTEGKGGDLLIKGGDAK